MNSSTGQYMFGAAAPSAPGQADSAPIVDPCWFPGREQDDADFQEKLKANRSQEMPEEVAEDVHRAEVQARAAVKAEDFKGAAKRYAQGLEAAPLWAQGRYNYALILAKLACPAEAVRQMKRYLLIAPHAPDARKAKDKIYEWEAASE